MTTRTIEGHIVYEVWHGDSEGKYIWQAGPALKDSRCYSQVDVCEHTLTFDMPEGFDPRPGQIAALESKKQRLQAETQAAITAINHQISKLQALEYSGSEA